jgi:MraZ protein
MQAFRPELYSLQRFLLEGVARCPVDRQGRVLVPPRLREWAGLLREVVVLGAGPRVELWEPGRLEQDLMRTGVNYGEYAALAGLGVKENPAGEAGDESPSG